MLESLEPRQLLASSPVDATWRFSQAAVDTAAGTHLRLEQVTDAGRGRTLMVGVARSESGYGGKSVIVALDATGALDKRFSSDGLFDPGLPATRPVKLFSSPEGYVYLISGDSVIRLRGDGGRDRSFSGAHALGIADDDAHFRLLDAKPNINGGFDVLRSVPRDLGRTFTNVYHIEEELFDSVVQLIHLDERGASTLVWEKTARQKTIADNVYLDFDIGSVTALTGGGWVVLSARQQNVDNVDSVSGLDIVGDTFVSFVSADGATTNERIFNTGDQTALADVRVQGNGTRVRFTYGGNREVELTDGTKIRRYTLAIGPTTPGLNDQVLAINGRRLPYHTPYPFNPETGFILSLHKTDGTLDTRFANGGKFKLPGTVGNYPGPFTVVSASPGSALLSWKNNDDADSLAIVRLWLTAQPAATLTGVSIRSQSATITVQYRAQTGIAAPTVNSHDLRLRSKRGEANLRLISRTVENGAVLATYRAVNLRRGSYFIDLLANEIGSNANATNDPERLGDFQMA